MYPIIPMHLVKIKIANRYLRLAMGAREGTRTPTPFGLSHLKRARLPISPPGRVNSFLQQQKRRRFRGLQKKQFYSFLPRLINQPKRAAVKNMIKL